MEFEGGIAAFHTPFGKTGIVFGRGQTAVEVVAAHGRCIGGYFVAVAAEQFVNGLVEGAPGQVPEGEVNGHDDFVGYRVCVDALAVVEVAPNLFAHKGVFANEFGLDHAVDHLCICTKPVSAHIFVG